MTCRRHTNGSGTATALPEIPCSQLKAPLPLLERQRRGASSGDSRADTSTRRVGAYARQPASFAEEPLACSAPRTCRLAGQDAAPTCQRAKIVAGPAAASITLAAAAAEALRARRGAANGGAASRTNDGDGGAAGRGGDLRVQDRAEQSSARQYPPLKHAGTPLPSGCSPACQNTR